jgi:hypothetical protein
MKHQTMNKNTMGQNIICKYLKNPTKNYLQHLKAYIRKSMKKPQKMKKQHTKTTKQISHNASNTTRKNTRTPKTNIQF